MNDASHRSVAWHKTNGTFKDRGLEREEVKASRNLHCWQASHLVVFLFCSCVSKIGANGSNTNRPLEQPPSRHGNSSCLNLSAIVGSSHFGFPVGELTTGEWSGNVVCEITSFVAKGVLEAAAEGITETFLELLDLFLVRGGNFGDLICYAGQHDGPLPSLVVKTEYSPLRM